MAKGNLPKKKKKVFRLSAMKLVALDRNVLSYTRIEKGPPYSNRSPFFTLAKKFKLDQLTREALPFLKY